ncbi:MULTISPECIES: hypothetical protein [Variovorax]|jgi:chromosome segregation ATPase|uniref:hypothetical protein n=1 Tax=Variovorax TaxID=34072 RepID=UPI001F32BE72|nr:MULTISPECIES: hypothetical protein [Variovorax]UKI07663.1 hypothetical protein L3V85_33515 [Variovorax paradoxus]
MPKLKKAPPAIDQIEKDFEEAVQRLTEGKPVSKRLQSLMRKGTLKVTLSNVAEEAGHSRTLISMENCKYPKIRILVDEVNGKAPAIPQTLTDLVKLLRATKAELSTKLKHSQAESAKHFLARENAEKRIAANDQIIANLRKRLQELNQKFAVISSD